MTDTVTTMEEHVSQGLARAGRAFADAKRRLEVLRNDYVSDGETRYYLVQDIAAFQRFLEVDLNLVAELVRRWREETLRSVGDTGLRVLEDERG